MHAVRWFVTVDSVDRQGNHSLSRGVLNGAIGQLLTARPAPHRRTGRLAAVHRRPSVAIRPTGNVFLRLALAP
ncbi:hypothetical protein Vlu01_50890 [Micromonospora lutea]|uniref:Uncharacterized protein n=1 Tax=Micromonospora lutea TaxID=419825 RepID=A0ABQ4J2R8_9ACTN|nr:hypothetical protein Vlu01_50890 [Micromonospora lutea]